MAINISITGMEFKKSAGKYSNFYIIEVEQSIFNSKNVLQRRYKDFEALDKHLHKSRGLLSKEPIPPLPKFY